MYFYFCSSNSLLLAYGFCRCFFFLNVFNSKKGQLYTKNHRIDRVKKLDLASHKPGLLELLCPSSLDKAGSNLQEGNSAGVIAESYQFTPY